MPRRIRERPCACGCGEMTKGGEFKPGHDAKLLSAIVREAGGVAGLRTMIENHIKRRIDFDLTD